MTEVISAILGAALAYYFAIRQEKKKDKKEEAHTASILYYDLKSIEDYITKEESSVNLRYSDDWQRIVANCIFLSHEQVECLYKIYDKTYNYNYFYSLMEQKKMKVVKEKVPQYKELREIMFDIFKGYNKGNEYTSEYKEIIALLKKHAMQ